MREVIHNLYVGENGELYCIKQNRIINIYDEGYPCSDCEFCFGSLQGEGVECKYRDIHLLDEKVVRIHDMKKEEERVNTYLSHMLKDRRKKIVLYGINYEYIPVIREKFDEEIVIQSFQKNFCKCDLGHFLIVNRDTLSQENRKYLNDWCVAFGMEFEFVEVDEETIGEDLDRYFGR